MLEVVNVNNLKRICKLVGIKQAALAKEVGVAQGVISDWQLGKYYPSTDNLIKLAKILNVSAGCLLDMEPIPEGYPDNYPKPVFLTEQKTEIVAEEPTQYKPAKKLPFNKEQIAYLDEWGDRLAERIVCSLKEDTFLLKETGTEEN